MKLTGMDEALSMLQKLPAEIVSVRGGPVRSSLRKGAMVIHKQAKTNLRAAVANATTEGERLSTGLLEKNLVVTRGKPPTSGKGERYLVRVRRKAYPDREGTSTLKSAQLLEYGSSQQPAEPYIRPAFEAKAREAIDVTTRELAKAIDKAAAKSLKQGK
jgi:HK97 gp10 family phage protein